jgi:hypothetical protein
MDIVTLSLSPAKGKQVRLDDEPASLSKTSGCTLLYVDA